MRLLKLLAGVLFILAFQTSCKKEISKQASSLPEEKTELNSLLSPPDVYVTGWESNSSGFAVAKYWLNASPVSLTDGTKSASGYAITISGGDIYVAGYEDNSSGTMIAKYWVNGTPVALTSGTNHAAATGIAVVGSDVYVCGWEENGSGVKKAVYWDNGTPVSLTNFSTEAFATGIAVDGGDVYVVGSDDDFAIYWLNGTPNLLPTAVAYPFTEYDPLNGSASAIKIVNGDVYISGHLNEVMYDALAAVGLVEPYETSVPPGYFTPYRTPCYWLNDELYFVGSPTYMFQMAPPQWDAFGNSVTRAIAVAEDIPYMAGYSLDNGPGTLPDLRDKGTYWIDSDWTTFPGGNTGFALAAVATGIQVADGDIYICGHQKGMPSPPGKFRAMYWVNESEVYLTDGTKISEAYGIWLE